MKELTPCSPISIRNLYWQKIGYCFLSLFLTIATVYVSYIFYSTNTGLRFDFNFHLLFNLVVVGFFVMIVLSRTHEISELRQLQKDGLKYYPLKAITDDKLEIMSAWGDVFPDIADFSQNCLSKNGLVTDDDYLVARANILRRLHIDDVHK